MANKWKISESNLMAETYPRPPICFHIHFIAKQLTWHLSTFSLFNLLNLLWKVFSTNFEAHIHTKEYLFAKTAGVSFFGILQASRRNSLSFAIQLKIVIAPTLNAWSLIVTFILFWLTIVNQERLLNPFRIMGASTPAVVNVALSYG